MEWWQTAACDGKTGLVTPELDSALYPDKNRWVRLSTFVEKQGSERKAAKQYIRKFTRQGRMVPQERRDELPEDADLSPDSVWNTNAPAQRAREGGTAASAVDSVGPGWYSGSRESW